MPKRSFNCSNSPRRSEPDRTGKAATPTAKSRFLSGCRTRVLVLSLLFFCAGCAGAPTKSIEAAQQAILRARAETNASSCMEKLDSAEAFLLKARQSMEQKDYERAKTEVFQSLQQANEAHRCAEENRKKETLLEENPDG